LGQPARAPASTNQRPDGARILDDCNTSRRFHGL
jgi:hypothetical protein